MPTYLVALAVCDYAYVDRSERGKEVSEEDHPGKGAPVLAADGWAVPSASGRVTPPSPIVTS